MFIGIGISLGGSYSRGAASGPSPGPELVPDPGFDTGVGHNPTGAWTITASQWRTTDTAFDNVTANETLVPGTYRITIVVQQTSEQGQFTLIRARVAGGAYVDIPGSNGVGTWTLDYVVGSVTNQTLGLVVVESIVRLDSWSVVQIA